MFNLTSNLAGFLALVLAGASPQSLPDGGPAKPTVHAGAKGDVKSPGRRIARKRARGSNTLHADGKPTTSPEEPSPVSIPALPMSPEELPARAPHVNYREGRLLVDSDNSTLDEILNAIRQETGAQIDPLPGGGSDRVAVHLFGSPRSVVSSLLDGAKFGYIILSPPQDPDGILKVIVTSQTQGESRPESIRPAERARPAAAAEPGPATEYRPANTAGSRGAELDSASSALPAPTQPPTQNSPIPPSGGSAADDQGASSAFSEAQRSVDPAPASNTDSNQTTKTPMQVLQELYRQRQQLQPQNQPPRPQPGPS
jgi:hypothetical protein